MRLTIDRDRCSGHGRCYTLHPELFSADEEGFPELSMPIVPPELEAGASEACDACPERAISVS